MLELKLAKLEQAYSHLLDVPEWIGQLQAQALGRRDKPPGKDPIPKAILLLRCYSDACPHEATSSFETARYEFVVCQGKILLARLQNDGEEQSKLINQFFDLIEPIKDQTRKIQDKLVEEIRQIQTIPEGPAF